MTNLILSASAASQDSTGATILAIILIIAFWVGLFILCRKLVLWYYKINERIETLEGIQSNQVAISEQLDKIIELLEKKQN